MFLLHTTERLLGRALSELSIPRLSDAVGTTIFQRGEKYYESGAVESIEYTNRTTLEATVSGSEFYRVEIYLEGDKIECDCSCPFDGGVCKHIVAVLLEAMNEGDNICGYPDNTGKNGTGVEQTTSKSPSPLASLDKTDEPAGANNEFQSYVESLSLKELQELVLRYAPEDFRRTVLTRVLSASDSEKLMRAVERAIDNILNDEYLRHDNAQLETELMRQCERLRGLWETFPERIAEKLTEIMTTIDAGFEEGDFYEGYDDYGFTSKKFDDYVIQFIRAVPLGKKNAVILGFENALGAMNYCTFQGIQDRKAEWFSVEELPAIKRVILEEIRAKQYVGNAELDYKTISPDLTDEERELTLSATHINSNFLTLEFADFYAKNGKTREALAVIDARLEQCMQTTWWSYHPYALAKRRFELAALCQEEPERYAARAKQILELSPQAELLLTAAKYLGALIAPLENIVAKKSPNEFFQYLDTLERFDECWAMILTHKNIGDEISYKFATRQMSDSPDNAAKIFLQRIEANKPHASNASYQIIAETLNYLNAINKPEAQEILSDLRANYKRRTNLMKRLDTYFRR